MLSGDRNRRVAGTVGPADGRGVAPRRGSSAAAPQVLGLRDGVKRTAIARRPRHRRDAGWSSMGSTSRPSSKDTRRARRTGRSAAVSPRRIPQVDRLAGQPRLPIGVIGQAPGVPRRRFLRRDPGRRSSYGPRSSFGGPRSSFGLWGGPPRVAGRHLVCLPVPLGRRSGAVTRREEVRGYGTRSA